MTYHSSRSAPAAAGEPLVFSVPSDDFGDMMGAVLGLTPETPPSLAGLESRPETYQTMTRAYEPLRDLLRARFGRR